MFLFGCSSAPEESTASGDESAITSRKSGFVTPNPSAEELQQLMTAYARVDPTHIIAQNLVSDAIAYYDANKNRLENADHMVIVDFSLHSRDKRFFVIDMTTGDVTSHAVAHGSGSDPNSTGYAKIFSNKSGSNASSLGFALTGETYNGKHGRSLRIDGLSSTNSAMRARAVVVHSAAYVHEDSSSKQGRSNGCFALDESVKDDVIDQLVGGALMYAGKGDPNSSVPRTSPDDTGDPSPADQPGDQACSVDDDCAQPSDGTTVICGDGSCTAGCRSDDQCAEGGSCVDSECKN